MESGEDAMKMRGKFLEIVAQRKPLVKTIEKGPHAGEKLRIDVREGTLADVEYIGVIGSKLVAKAGVRAPVAGAAKVIDAQVAQDYWRAGIGRMLYTEIASDLRRVGAKLVPQSGEGVMTPDAVHFWRDFAKEDTEIQRNLDDEMQEMEESGFTRIHEQLKKTTPFWNGEEYTGKGI